MMKTKQDLKETPNRTILTDNNHTIGDKNLFSSLQLPDKFSVNILLPKSS